MGFDEVDYFGAYDAGAQSQREITGDQLLRIGQLEKIVSEFQKRIDEALELLEYNEYADSTSQAINILKGK